MTAGGECGEASEAARDNERMATARETSLAERAAALRQVAALEREFAGIAEAAGSAGTDDEHDPEGARPAFERQHAAALLQAARDRVAAIDAALDRLPRRAVRRVRALRAADRRGPAGGPSGRADLHPLRRHRGSRGTARPRAPPPRRAAGHGRISR